MILTILVFILWVDISKGVTVQRALTREETLEELKGRYNYASSDCAARVLASNRGCKSSSAILQSQKDSYLRNLCAYSQKHVILELCQDIRIDTIVLANFEYFSSMVREFRVAVSRRYPVAEDGWREVGRFMAENNRREQVFPVGGTGYARYVRVDFDSHYGNEYYCLLSVFRVFGKTMMEDFEESSSSAKPNKAKVDSGLSPSAIGSRGDASSTTTSLTWSSAPVPVSISEKAKANSQTKASTDLALVTLPPLLKASKKDELTVVATDLMDIFKYQAVSFCRARPTVLSSAPSEMPVVDSVSDDGDSPVLPQENVFKAIHDRLHQLERNVTRSSRNLEGDINRLMADLQSVKEEIGVTSYLGASPNMAVPSHGTASSDSSSRASFRARLLRHLERKSQEFSHKILNELDVALEQAERTARLVWWMAVVMAFQILGLISVVTMGLFGEWFKRDFDATNTSKGPLTHRQSLSVGVLMNHSPALSANPLPGQDESEQLVPQSPELVDKYRGTSPAHSDLIVTASRPLLLDESEAELIDAVYVPSPCTSRSSLGGVSSLPLSGTTSRPGSRVNTPSPDPQLLPIELKNRP